MQKLNFQNERPFQVVFTSIKTFKLLFNAIYPFTIKIEHFRGPLWYQLSLGSWFNLDFSWQVQENHDWYQYSENCSIPWLKTLLKFPVSTSITCVWCLRSCHWGNIIILVCFQILQSEYSNGIKIIKTAITINRAVLCMQGISSKNL